MADPHASEGEEEPTWAESRAYPLGESDSQSGPNDFIGRVWRMVDRSIEENPFLSEYNHTGQVFLRFEVDESGELEKRTVKASATDNVLKVIAARAVRKALKNETGEIPVPHRRVVINARFSWLSNQACQGLRGRQGNFISFCHYAENKRKSFSGGERAGAYAGAIWNHGPWAAEEIKKYNREASHRRTEFDPFEVLERDPDWNL